MVTSISPTGDSQERWVQIPLSASFRVDNMLTKRYKHYKYDGEYYIVRKHSSDKNIIKEVNKIKLYDLVNVNYHKDDYQSSVIDIGCHIGSFVRKCNNYLMLPKPIKLYAYDFFWENIALAQLNNFLDWHTVHHKCIVGNKIPRYVDFDDRNYGSYKLVYDMPEYKESKLVWLGGKKDSFYLNINDLLDKHESVYILKLDAEGSEFPIFEAISEENLKKIKYLFVEFHNDFVFKSGNKDCKFTKDTQVLGYLDKWFDVDYFNNHVSKEYDTVLSHARFVRKD